MHFDTIERAMSPLTSHAWFFDLYGRLIADPRDALAEIASRVDSVDLSDPIESGLVLFLAAQHAELTDDSELVTATTGLVDTVGANLERQMQPGANRHAETWTIALWSAGLRLANLALDSADLARVIGGVKNHVYARHTRGGTLMSSSDRENLDYTVLLAAVPFGLFDPEDLVLVDAVRTLASAECLAAAAPEDRALLAWYFAEQGSYSRSRVILAGSGTTSLAPVVADRLRAMGQLGERFIRHSPFGNGNRYEPLVEERFPKLVTAEDEVIVRALAAPLSETEPLELVIGGAVTPGTLRDGHWEFRLPRYPAGTAVSYAIRFRRHPAESVGPFSYEVQSRRAGGRLTLAGSRLTFVPGDAPIEPLAVGAFTVADVSWLESAGGRIHEITLTLTHPPCGFYGFGERYNALNQAGNRVDQFVYNQYKDQGLRTYIPMPVAYTDAGFGLHIATDNYSWFDLETPGVTRLGIEAPTLELDLFAGTINEQVAQFMAATGEPESVPAWALGPWMSSNNWDSEAEVRKQVELTNRYGIPSTVLVIEAWSDEATFYIFNDAQYAGKTGANAFSYDDFTFPEWGRWPDPKALIGHLHDNGLKLILWQIPIIKQSANLRHAQKRRDEEHFLGEGYAVTHPDGTPLRLPEGWFKDSLLMDFTNPAGVDWWFKKRQYLIDLGVDGFKTDGGEMVWGRDLRFADGTTGLTNRNAYPRDYISAYYRFAQQNGGICFSRAGYTGAQTFPAHWAGDERSTWDAFKRSILAGLSAGMSGVIFWGWDLGGFSGDVPGAELYIRSAQMACFCPIMQYHAESKAEFNQDRTPWNIAERSGDDRALTGYAFYANLRMQLLPYLTREAAHCVAARTPLMRAMLLDHEDDPMARALWDQYRLGRDLLVAPIIHEGETSRDVYLPKGRWWHLFQNRWFEGGRTHRVDAPLEEIPVFVREGAILPLAFDDEVRLGATMRSGVNAPHHTVLLTAVKPGSTATCEGVSVATDSDSHVSVEGVPPGHILLFTDAPASITVNGRQATLETLAVTGAELPTVRSPHPTVA